LFTVFYLLQYLDLVVRTKVLYLKTTFWRLCKNTKKKKMSNSSDKTLEDEKVQQQQLESDDKISNTNQRTEPSQEWETMARAWVSAFPDAKAVVSAGEVETWIGTNLDSLPADLRHMPRSEIVDRLLSIQHYMRPTPSSDQNEVTSLID